MIYCTIACANYMAQAHVMAKSLKETNPDTKVALCLVERDEAGCVIDPLLFDCIILARDLGIPRFEQFMFRHSALEACTAVKATFLLRLLRDFPSEICFAFLDPDIEVRSNLRELKQALIDDDIVVTPHLVADQPGAAETLENVLRVAQYGVMNLGCLGVRRSVEGLNFLTWLESRLAGYCYDEIGRGLFVDQKWVELAMGLFPIKVLRHAGYNVANWNVSGVGLRKQGSTYVVGDSIPLRFFHYSGIFTGRDLQTYEKLLSVDHCVYELRAEYLRSLVASGWEDARQREWSYARYLSGQLIDMRARRSYRNTPRVFMNVDLNPFQLTNEDVFPVSWSRIHANQ